MLAAPGGGRRVENLKAWIFRVALNTGRDIRETAWRRKRQGLPEDESTIASRHDGPVEIVEHDERLTRLREAMQQLRPEEQEVFLLRQNGELTYEEIAETARRADRNGENADADGTARVARRAGGVIEVRG